MGGVGPRPPCAPLGSMRGPGPALRVPPSHPGECLGGGVRVYLWRTPPAWGSGLGSAYARTLGNKPENVPGAELLRVRECIDWEKNDECLESLHEASNKQINK